MRRRLLLTITLTLLAVPAPAGAAVIQDFSGFQSATNGIALGPDGNFWVAEENTSSVARMTPAGAVIDRLNVGAGPTSVTTGPDGTVWVAVTSATKLARIDTRQSPPGLQTFSMGAGCGPVAIADGGNGRMYFSQPASCGGSNYIGSIAANGTGIMRQTTASPIYDLAVFGGKVFAPSYEKDNVQRYGLGLGAAEASVAVPAGGFPDGITVDTAGSVWVSLNSGGGVARFPAGQNNGQATTFPPVGGSLTEAFGIAAAPGGGVYVAGKGSGNLARVSPDGKYTFYAAGGDPFDLVNGPDGDVYFTDRQSTRVRRLISGAPRVSAIAGTGTATTSANVSATVDARGNTTTVVFEYGLTSSYGTTATTQVTEVGPKAATATLTGLTPGTTYHLRVKATNEEGEVVTADSAFATPAAPVPPPSQETLKARANFSWGFIGARTALTRVRISGLGGGETIRVTCKGGGCPFKTKTYKDVKQGTRTLTTLFGKKQRLRTKAKIEIRITKPGAVGSTTTLTIGKRKKDPKIVRKTVKPA